ncbi:MAG TPA: DUF4105 domain-containing protein [Candidatus Binatia bacterium]|nr:DUF4105 domain-containing protein [Candidatus Binatia bacterium]
MAEAVVLPLYLFLAVLLAFLCLNARPGLAQIAPQAYLQDLLQRARAASLHEQRYWRLLLHYRSNWHGGYESEIDEPGFFLAADGKTDPQAELDATLAAFFSPEPVGRSRQPARCAFIARYEWLKSALGIDPSRLPVESCDRFHAWYKELNPASLTLIFPSAFLNNPASSFGHLLLRVDQKGQTESTKILAYTINYAAEMPPDVGVEYVYLGVFGGYTGYFSTMPYYLKAKEYGDFENRDIWEYRLNLTAEQIHRVLLHAWEMGNASFDYFFFKENCAYHILALLDLADPGLHLADRFLFYTFPSDGVRAIAETPNLIEDAVFRPSRRTRIVRGREGLSADEREWLQNIVKDPNVVRSETFARLNPDRRAAVLDVASDYFLYKAAGETDPAPFEAQNSVVLLARSQLKVPAPAAAYRPFSGPPDQGHNVLRAGIGAGWRDGELFSEANFRLAFHDLLDPEYGYTPDAQIEALSIALRHYYRRNHTRVDRLTLVKIVSLSPVDSLFFTPSWKLDTGFDTIHRNGCRFCLAGRANGGLGLALESRWFKREIYFGFAEIVSEYGKAFDRSYRVGGGLSAGALVDITERWKIGASTAYLGFPLGDKRPEWRVSAQQRFTLTKDLSLRFDFNQRGSRQDYLLNLHVYF